VRIFTLQKTIKQVALLLLAATATHSFAADDTYLPAVVVTAAKLDPVQDESPHAVTVITQEDLIPQNHTDLVEVLRAIPGLEARQAGGPGQFNSFKLRGYGSGHFLVLIDGVKVNENFNFGVGQFLGHLDPQLIERIEVLRGPQAALYGSDTTAGVIAITTKRGQAEREVTVGAEYGSLAWKKGYTSAQGQTGDLGYAFNLAYTDSDNLYEHEYYENISPHLRLTYATEPFTVDLSLLYIESEFGYAELDENFNTATDRSQWWAFQTPDPHQFNRYQHYLTSLQFEQQLNDAWRHTLLLGWFKKDTHSDDDPNGFLGAQQAPFDGFSMGFGEPVYNQGEWVPIFDDDSNGEAYGNEDETYQADYNLLWDSALGNDIDNIALLGVEYNHKKGGRWGRFGDLTEQVNQYSLYLNDQLLIGDAWTLNAGVRYDHHEEFGSHTTGKIGALYRLQRTQTDFFANYGTSFRAPAFLNLYDAQYGNPDVQPEEGWMAEFGIRQQFTLNQRPLALELTYWLSELDDVIAFDFSIPNDNSPFGSGLYVNRDKAETEGVEFVIHYPFTPQWTMHGNYTYTDATSEAQGVTTRFPQVARHKGNLGLVYATDQFSLSADMYYVGARLRWRGDVEMEKYVRFDLAATYYLTKGFKLYGRLENLLDRDVEEALGYQSPGRYAVAGVAWTF